MNGKVLFVFIILLLGLILCSFLGGSRCLEEGMETMEDTDATTTTTTAPNAESNVQDLTTALSNVLSSAKSKIESKVKSKIESKIKSNQYDNYNHFDKMASPILYYGPDGGTARVITTPNNNSIVITYKNGTTHIYYIDEHAPDPTTATYHGPNSSSAKIVTDKNGKQVVEITSGTGGSKIIYTSDRPQDDVQQDDTLNQYDGNTNTTGSDYDTAHYPSSNYSGIQSNTISGPSGNTYSTYDSSAYFNSLPQGVPRSQIPFGQEDLYILKTQVVPPVCPAPTIIYKDRYPDRDRDRDPDRYNHKNDATKCPPCPACQRCPEPAFECKKVPNYTSINQDFMPMPVLGDFSTFGM